MKDQISQKASIITLKFIVNGTPTTVTDDIQRKLSHAVKEALEQTGNTARGLADWQVMYQGQILDMNVEIALLNLPEGAELFLSLKAGHGGNRINNTQFVDPSVSKHKFDSELKLFMTANESNRRRGIILLSAIFPDICLYFAAKNLQPPPIVFAVRLNFDNYDIEPPSITFIDPFSLDPIKIDQMATHFHRKIAVENNQIQLQALVQQDSTNLPFFCIPGIREYHKHPAHTGDSWFLHRKIDGEGSLGYIVEKLFQYGVAAVNSYQMQLQFNSQKALLGLDLNTVSA